jgi:hypothetical protein
LECQIARCLGSSIEIATVGTRAGNAVLDPMIAARRANDFFILFGVVGTFEFFSPIQFFPHFSPSKWRLLEIFL